MVKREVNMVATAKMLMIEGTVGQFSYLFIGVNPLQKNMSTFFLETEL